ncbi:MAG TPA: tetratricopeptide repeat protein [Terriglobales bacterium]|nr:tetratricopeptide repeat protein [Terriglobales bacterium]
MLVFLALPLIAQQGEMGSVVGQIRIARSGFPSARIQVTLQTRGAIVDQQWTDDEGKFAFYQLATNIYHVVIDDEKYEHYEEQVNVNPVLSRTSFLNPTLTPKPGVKPTDESNRVGGSNPYIVDTAAYKRQFPKQVVKEFESGVKEQDKGKLDKAVRHFQAAIAAAPDFYPAHNNLGTVYLTQKNFAGAQEEFETALRLNQSDTQAYFNLGNVFLLTQRYDDAQRVLRQGIQRLPNVALGHFLLGTALARGGQNDDAEKELRKAQELDPLVANVHLELVNLYLKEHNDQQAIAELHVFLQRFPEDPLAPKARDLLGRLEGPANRKP